MKTVIIQHIRYYSNHDISAIDIIEPNMKTYLDLINCDLDSENSLFVNSVQILILLLFASSNDIVFLEMILYCIFLLPGKDIRTLVKSDLIPFVSIFMRQLVGIVLTNWRIYK